MHDFHPVVRAAVGRDPVGAERLTGGSKKGAYRVHLDDGGTVLVYVWDESEDYWQGVLRMHLNLVAGPLRIAGTGHPEHEWFRGVAEHHLQRALAY
jgi:hypothetical protein